MSDTGAAFTVLSIPEAEAVPIEGGALQWIPVRRRLGIGAFGTNAYRAPHRGDVVIEDHVESPGQEEMYVVISGRVRFTVGDDEVDVPQGSVVFLARPDVRRRAVALEDGTTVLAVGGWRDQAYHALPWEPIYLAQDAMARGDWAAAAATLEREAGEHRDTAIVRFRLACCLAQSDQAEQALQELRRAVQINPRMRAMADGETLLAPLREQPGWAGAVGPSDSGRA